MTGTCCYESTQRSPDNARRAAPQGRGAQRRVIQSGAPQIAETMMGTCCYESTQRSLDNARRAAPQGRGAPTFTELDPRLTRFPPGLSDLEHPVAWSLRRAQPAQQRCASL